MHTDDTDISTAQELVLPPNFTENTGACRANFETPVWQRQNKYFGYGKGMTVSNLD